jgi:hypothetical protein
MSDASKQGGSTPVDGEALIRDLEATRNLPTYVWRSVTHILVSSVLGFVVDKVLKYLQVVLGVLPLILVAVQIVIGVSILYAIEKYVAPKWAEAWLNATPGTLFNVFFFGVQFNLLENLVAVGRGNGLVSPAVALPAEQVV